MPAAKTSTVSCGTFAASSASAVSGVEATGFRAPPRLVTVDGQGGKSSFSFTNLQENVGLADKEFDFKVPRGVDLVTDPSLRR